MTDTTSIKHPTPLTSGDFTAAEEPFALFGDWFAEAVKAEPNDPDAMSLATVDADGLPDVRMVLMKGYDADGFVFYSHIASQKGRELATNPKAALLFHWKSLRRQVRIRGNVSPVTEAEADAYFATRRLFRDTAKAGADRRLGQQAVAAAGKPLCLRAGNCKSRGQTHRR
jgi:pyridoxamine 5'-phosphate oxidase